MNIEVLCLLLTTLLTLSSIMFVMLKQLFLYFYTELQNSIFVASGYCLEYDVTFLVCGKYYIVDKFNTEHC